MKIKQFILRMMVLITTSAIATTDVISQQIVRSTENTSRKVETSSKTSTSYNSQQQRDSSRKREVLESIKHGNYNFTIERETNYNNYRTNPDGTKYYESNFYVTIGNFRYNVSDNLYQPVESKDYLLPVSLAFNTKDGDAWLYALSKDSNTRTYSMTGYLYKLSNNRIEKNVIFSNANLGWMPYFEIENDQLVLNMFSFAGYFSMKGIFSAKNSFSIKRMGYIKPENFERIRRGKTRILPFYIDYNAQMATRSSNNASQGRVSNNYSSSSSNSSNSSLREGVVTALSIGGVAALAYGLWKLATNTASSSSSYSSSSSSSYRSSPSYSSNSYSSTSSSSSSSNSRSTTTNSSSSSSKQKAVVKVLRWNHTPASRKGHDLGVGDVLENGSFDCETDRGRNYQIRYKTILKPNGSPAAYEWKDNSGLISDGGGQAKTIDEMKEQITEFINEMYNKNH